MYINKVKDFLNYFYEKEVKPGISSNFDRYEIIAIEMFANWLDRQSTKYHDVEDLYGDLET